MHKFQEADYDDDDEEQKTSGTLWRLSLFLILLCIGSLSLAKLAHDYHWVDCHSRFSCFTYGFFGMIVLEAFLFFAVIYTVHYCCCLSTSS